MQKKTSRDLLFSMRKKVMPFIFGLLVLLMSLLPLGALTKQFYNDWKVKKEKMEAEKQAEFIECVEKKFGAKHLVKNTFQGVKTKDTILIFNCP